MRNELLRFSKEYDDEIISYEHVNSRTITYGLLVDDVPEQIKNFPIVVTNNYKVKGSCGQGNWTINPWISIFDTEVTSKASEGYYIVYLFDDLRKYLFLSINQAWTPYKESLELHSTSLRLEAAELIARE